MTNKQTSILTLILLSIILAVFIGAIKYAPKGNSYIEYESNMIKSGQMKAEHSQYFNK